MRDPELAGRIVEAVVKAVDVPVTVKFRKGWDGGSVNAVEFAKVCEQAGASAIAVHGRTRAQMYAGKADWDIIRDVKRAVTIPVFANGDVFSGADAAHILRYTGCDLAMVGRGCFGDPWLFRRANAALAGEPEPELPPLKERIDLAVRADRDGRGAEGRASGLSGGPKPVLLVSARRAPRRAVQAGGRARVSTLEELRQVARRIQLNLK